MGNKIYGFEDLPKIPEKDLKIFKKDINVSENGIILLEDVI